MHEQGAHPLAAAAAARAAMSQLLTARTRSLGDGELRALLDDLQALAAQADAVRLAGLRAVEARPEVVPGAMAPRAASVLLMTRRVSPRQARLDALVARHTDPDTGQLRQMGAAFAAGLIWRAHLDVAVRALDRIPRRLLAKVDADGVTGAERVDACLTEQALAFAPSDVEVLARHLLALLDPDGTDRRDREGFMRRRCHAAFDSTGMLIGSFQLDAEAGAVVSDALAAFSAPLPATMAVSADGEVVETRDVRDRGQRQADALAVICGIALGQARPGPVENGSVAPAASGPAGHGPARPSGFPSGTAFVGRLPAHILVTATVDQLAGNPAAGLAIANLNGPVSPGTLRRLVCDAVLQKVLLAPSGAVLDLGRSVRLATSHQRRAITARDGSCLVPGCVVPVAMCDLHHVRSWVDGGRTDLPNLAPLCPRHHTAVHCGEWALTVHDGLPWVIPPPWVDPLRRPVRNPFTDAVQSVLRMGQALNDAPGEPVSAAAHGPEDRAADAVASDVPEQSPGTPADPLPEVPRLPPDPPRDGESCRPAA